MYYDLKQENILHNDFMYAYSPACNTFKTFSQEKDCVVNGYDKEEDNYDYVSVVTRDTKRSGTTVRTHCSFEHYGAPLVVFSEKVERDEQGIDRYGLHFEVVAWENGVNIWHIVPQPAGSEKPIAVTKIGKAEFAIEENSNIEIKVCVGSGEAKNLKVIVNGHELNVVNEDLPEEFHIGFTACEGINRFYDFEIVE